MRYVGCWVLACWLLAISTPPVLGQDAAEATEAKAAAAEAKAPADETDSPKPSPKKPSPKKAGPMKAEFDRLFSDWKEMVGELATLQVKFYRADEQERAEIDQQWKQLIAKGDAMEPKLIEAAEKAYAEAPNADGDLTKFLVNIVRGEVLADKNYGSVPTEDYERAWRIGKLLMENECEYAWVYNPAGIAAFVMQDLETAEKYLKLAEENKTTVGGSSDVLDGLVRGFLAKPDDSKGKWASEQKIREVEAKADDLPRVLLKTSQGEMELELFENEAPNTVANYISLVKKGFYDGLAFHRVLPGFMAQGGCPKGDGQGSPGYSIPCECYQENHRNHFRGSLAMAKGMNPVTRLARDTGGSQFYICFVPTSMLDGEYTVFGRVVKGFEVLHKIQRRDPDGPPGQPKPDTIVEATVLRDRGHEYTPKKVE